MSADVILYGCQDWFIFYYEYQHYFIIVWMSALIYHHMDASTDLLLYEYQH